MKEIFERRSVRQYTEKELSQEVIENLLRAAMRAPSASNHQPWEFVVLRERAQIDRIPEIHPYAQMLKQATCAIVVCGNKQRQPTEFWVQDCSAATQNLLLEAVHFGVGAVWLGVYPMEERTKAVQELLGLPEYIVPLNVISLGYPAQIPEPIDTYRPEFVHWEKW